MNNYDYNELNDLIILYYLITYLCYSAYVLLILVLLQFHTITAIYFKELSLLVVA